MILDALLSAPSNILGFATSSAAIIALAIAAYAVYALGYPRPYWTHHSYDPFLACKAAVERSIRACDAIAAALGAGRQCSTLSNIKRMFGYRLSGMVRSHQTCTSDLSNAELVDACVEAILQPDPQGVPRKVEELVRAWKSIADVEPNRTVSGLITQDGTPEGRRTACAIADLRLVMYSVIPKIQKVHREQTKEMSDLEIISHHVTGDFDNWKARKDNAFNVPRDGKAERKANRVIENMRSLGKNLMRH